MNLERDVNDLETKWGAWDVASRGHVADEQAENEMRRVRAENSRGGLMLATDAALETYEDEWRARYDREQAVAATILDAETKSLASAVEDAIVASATLASERDMHATSTANGLMAGVLEELIQQRLAREFGGLTLTTLHTAYSQATDERDRTLVRMVEHAVTTGQLARLGLRADVEHDAAAILDLQQRVATRRKARVAPALYGLRGRLHGLRTLTREQTRAHLDAGRGIARRPRPMMVTGR